VKILLRPQRSGGRKRLQRKARRDPDTSGERNAQTKKEFLLLTIYFYNEIDYD
jgi:hypothetical protein